MLKIQTVPEPEIKLRVKILTAKVNAAESGTDRSQANCVTKRRGSEWGLVFSVICPYFLVFTVKLAIF